MITLFPELENAIFIKRLNRFVILVKYQEKQILLHLPNSGRMSDLLVPQAKIWFVVSKDESRKTAGTAWLVEYDNQIIAIHSLVANDIFKDCIDQKKISFFKDFYIKKAEATKGDSRFDFLLEKKEGILCYVEVKSVNLVKDGIAQFPDAPTKRGVKHIKELMKLNNEGFMSAIVFVVLRNDAHSFMPCYEIHEEFGSVLKQACHAGVHCESMMCYLTKNGCEKISLLEMKFK